jgi:N,N'-diacetyllegionaminate synthase
MPTIIIAEAGVNHNGDVRLARKLIEVAGQAGADYVKFQTFDSNKLVTNLAKKADYQINISSDTENQFQMLQKLELPLASYKELAAFAKMSGVGFLSTAFDTESLNFLLELGMDFIKIPSGEITNFPFLRYVGGLERKVLLSSGASSLEEIRYALSILQRFGTKLDDITVLHCTSAYPAPFHELNLLALKEIASEFGVRVGYSDHSEGITIAIGAVALGANVIEKHFTLDKSMEGPDHKASLNPQELKEMIAGIRQIDSALGNGQKKTTASEFRNQLLIRRSIVANQNILRGELFSEHNLTTKRPADGISPMYWEDLIGKQASRDYSENDQIEFGS